MSGRKPEENPLARAAGGELDHDDARVRAALDGPGGPEESAEWESTRAAVESFGAEERELLARAAEESARPEDLAEVRAGLERAGLRADHPRRRSLLTWGAAAAGLALTAAFLRREGGPGKPDDPIFLGSEALELLAPTERDADFARFIWRAPGATADTRYALVVRADGAELLRHEELEEPRWTLTEGERERLATVERIEWRVGRRDVGETSYGRWTSRVSLRR